MGRLKVVKGYDLLINIVPQVISQVPDVVFWIAGIGLLRAELENQVERLGVGNHVRFLGLRQDIPDLMAAADLFVLPSRIEGIPGALLEAMGMGMPTVAFNINGVSEAIEHEETGLLVPAEDSQALAEAIIRILSDHSMGAALGTQAKLAIMEGFSLDKMCQQYEELFTVLYAPRGSGMNFVLPRYIHGNRGDIASRWGLLRALHNLGEQDGTVFCVHPEDAPQGLYPSLPCGKYHNLILNRDGRSALAKADTILWCVGLDMQDDLSLARLLYLRVLFGIYRQMGKRIWCLFQGAGPVTTPLGSLLARQALSQVDCFVARDPGTLSLLQRLSPYAKIHLGYDAIFLPGFEADLEPLAVTPGWYQALWNTSQPVVGLNIRQWFHFSSSLLPYEFSKKKYLARSLPQMEQLLDTITGCVQQLRQRFQARLLLISAYQPGVVPWEDDLTWLERLKARFADDPQVVLVNETIPMPLYYQLMSRLDLMIGMRLHSSLIALRFGVPAINLSYTLKGKDIYDYLGLADNVIALPEVLAAPDCIIEMADRILSDARVEREKTHRVVAQAIEKNSQLLCEILKSH